MKQVTYSVFDELLNNSIQLPASKSISNRALVLQALLNWKFQQNSCKLSNLSTADDTRIMQRVLLENKPEIDLKNAGTCFRFLTAYYALTTSENKIITGSDRLKKRPIAGLVDALLTMGASIEYLENDGYAPLLIKPSKIKSDKTLKVSTENSSQFLSALILIAPFTDNVIAFWVDPESRSFSYVRMTLGVLQSFGMKWRLNDNCLLVYPLKSPQDKPFIFEIEADWSAAAFFYGVQSIVKKGQQCLNGLRKNSIQGDVLLAKMASDLGVETTFNENGICIQTFKHNKIQKHINWDFSQCPDLAPVLILAAVLNVESGTFIGLDNLNFKESQRLKLLNDYLKSLGVQTSLTTNTLEFRKTGPFSSFIQIDTALDHRMVMAATLLSFVVKSVYLNEVDSVEKSFPEFWEQAKKLGFAYLN